MENIITNILVVDDDAIMLNIIETGLNNIKNINIKTTNCAKNAIDLFLKQDFDIVLTDLAMPQMDGLELTKQLFELKKDILIILMTGFAEQKHLEKAINLGISNYINKPFELETLQSIITDLIKKINSRKQELQEKDKLAEILTNNLNNEAETIKKVEKQQEEFRKIIEYAPNAILIVEKESDKIFILNQSAKKLFDIKDNNNNLILTNSLNPIIYEKFQTIKHKIISDKNYKICSEKFEISENIIIEFSAYPLIENNKIKHIVYIANDITQKENFHKQIMLSSRLAGIGELAAGVAHEINNPIGFVTSNTNSMKRYMDKIFILIEESKELIDKDNIEKFENLYNELKIPSAIKNCKDIIYENMDGLKRITKIVRDLKTFAHIDKKISTNIDIKNILEDTLNLVRNETKYKIEIKKDYKALQKISCFPGQISQVFTNIIINASQAIEKKGIISIKTMDKDNQILISIKDDGPGIPDKILSKIFNPFFTTKPCGKGTGLGLSIVFDIIKKHNGNITVKSIIGQGTEFIITLPLKQIESANTHE